MKLNSLKDLFVNELHEYRAAPADLREAPLVSQAAAAYEDRGLFTRPSWVPPISGRGVVRAIGRNLRGIPEGGSTIPQQLAKLYLRGGHRASIADKSRELLLATWMVRQMRQSLPFAGRPASRQPSRYMAQWLERSFADSSALEITLQPLRPATLTDAESGVADGMAIGGRGFW